jgi:hypothetical protein
MRGEGCGQVLPPLHCQLIFHLNKFIRQVQLHLQYLIRPQIFYRDLGIDYCQLFQTQASYHIAESTVGVTVSTSTFVHLNVPRPRQCR